MIAVALSLLFGVIAFAAIAQIAFSSRQGIARGRFIVGQLARIDNASQTVIRFADCRPVVAAWQPQRAAA